MPAATKPAPKSVLAADALYLGDNGRIFCSAVRCAGMTATSSGRDLSGQRAARVTAADVAEWATYDLGPMTCEGGHVTLSAVCGPDGFPLAR